ncbi:MAG: DNA polymerase III subunit delta [Syntrophomonadaceae bacterium]|nr:DNA polymerase III subunit delta [Syntrophomonadaceae bacterium]
MSPIKTVPPLILLWGPEDYLLERRLNEIIDQMKQYDGDEPEVVSLDSLETKPSALEQYLAEVPLFAHRRVVLMRHPPWLEKPAKSGIKEWESVIGSFVRSEPHQLHLILTANKKPGSRAIDELIRKHGEALEVPGISPRRLADWITEELKKTGVKIQREALAVLVKSGRDMNYLARELERLALCHRGQTVTTGDLTGIESDPASFNVFQLTDALLKKNTREALQALASLLHKGEPVTLIVHMITRELVLLGKVQALAARGEPSSTIARILGKQRFRVDKMLRSSMSTEDLRYALKRMAEIDYAVKNTSQDHRLLLETMIVEICENRHRMPD